MTTMTDLERWLDLRAWVEADATRGNQPRLVVEATVPEGGHMEAHEPPEPFLIPTTLDVIAPDGITVGAIEYPPAEERRFEWSPMVLHVLAGTARFEVPLEVRPGAAEEPPRTVTARLSYQGCIDGACLPPNMQSIDVMLTA